MTAVMLAERPESATTLDGMDVHTAPADAQLIAAQEAELRGKTKAQVSRARKDPNHPVHGPAGGHLTAGKLRLPTAPRALIDAYWDAREAAQPGPGRPRRNPPKPDGWSHHQWRSLLAHARIGAPLTDGVRAVLVERGVLDDTGALTPAGRALITHDTATDGATRQEQQQ